MRETLQERYENLRATMSSDPKSKSCIALGQQLLLDVRKTGRYLDDDVEREYYAQIARDLGNRLFDLTDEYLPVRLMPFEPRASDAVPKLFHSLSPDTSTRSRRQLVDLDQLATAQQRLAALSPDTRPTPAALPPCSRMPLSRNPLFVGREEALQTLAAQLRDAEMTASGPIVAVTGLAGIGKTQLASEFVHLYGQFFAGGVFWLRCEAPTEVGKEIAACGGAGALDLRPDFLTLPPEAQIRLVQAAWQSPVPRLLVFDACEDETLLARWKPSSGGCRILVTSRRGQWDPTLRVQVLPLDVLCRKDSIALLRQLCPDLLANDTGLDELTALLGDLPLALHLAGSFLQSYQYTYLETYIADLRAANVLTHRSLKGEGSMVSPTNHIRDVEFTFAQTYKQFHADDPIDQLAQVLLVQAASFPPETPFNRAELLRPLLQKAAEDSLHAFRVEKALRRLIALGLLELTKAGQLRLHCLLRRFVQTRDPVTLASAVSLEALLAASPMRSLQRSEAAPRVSARTRSAGQEDASAGREAVAAR